MVALWVVDIIRFMILFTIHFMTLSFALDLMDTLAIVHMDIRRSSIPIMDMGGMVTMVLVTTVLAMAILMDAMVIMDLVEVIMVTECIITMEDFSLEITTLVLQDIQA